MKSIPLVFGFFAENLHLKRIAFLLMPHCAEETMTLLRHSFYLHGAKGCCNSGMKSTLQLYASYPTSDRQRKHKREHEKSTLPLSVTIGLNSPTVP
jgi:hypothetical protein